MPVSTKITPTGEHARFTEWGHGPVRPMTATLLRSQGSWWLVWEDGKEGDTHHASTPGHGFRLADMVKLLTGK